jgi:predicted MFS family arabinose efflux permease
MEPRLLSRSFVLVVLSTFGVFASFGFLIYALPLYTRDVLHASDAGVGLAMGVASIGAILVGPPSGRLSDRLGRRPVLFAGALAMVAGYLVLALEPPFGVVVPLRVVAGAAEAAFVVAALTMAVDLAPERRHGEATSLVTVGSYSGLALGPPAAALLLGDDRFTLVWIVAAVLVAMSALFGAFVPETRHDHEEAHAGWLPPRRALMPGLVLFLALLGFGGFNAFVVLYARDIGVGHSGLVFAIFGAVVIAVRVLGRRLPDRLGSRLAASIACLAVATGFVIVAAWETPAGLYLGTAVFAVGQALAYPALVLLAMGRTAPSERSAAVGAVAAFVDVALATGGLALGLVADAFDYRAVFVVGAASALVGLALLQEVGRERGVEVEPAPNRNPPPGE